MQGLSNDMKRQSARLITKKFISAIQEDLYPCQASEAIFGVKMQKNKPKNMKDMATGAIVFNVWTGLYKSEIINEEWIEKALLDGDLPKQFENKVCQSTKLLIQNGGSAGFYMPELISRGFDKIVWDTQIHNAVKLN